MVSEDDVEIAALSYMVDLGWLLALGLDIAPNAEQDDCGARCNQFWLRGG